MTGRERPVHCSVMLGIRRWRGSDPPSEEFLKIVKALATDPVIVIERAVALVQDVRNVLDHELGPAEAAVIVVPAWLLRVSPIRAMPEFQAPQVAFLPLQPPVVGVDHFCMPNYKSVEQRSTCALAA